MTEPRRSFADAVDEWFPFAIGVVVIVLFIGFVALAFVASDWASEGDAPAAIATTTTPAAPSSTAAPVTSTTTTGTSTTTMPTTTSTLPPIAEIEPGLSCRDLDALGYDYDTAVLYWVEEGSPARMDADGNGIPCETVYPEADVLAHWGDPLPTTTIPAGDTSTVAAVVAWVQHEIDVAFAASDPPPHVTGPSQLDCAVTGTIGVGEVLSCMLWSAHDPDYPLEDAGIVIYVLDASGRSAWSAGTDVPRSTRALRSAYEAAPHGLFCRDLLSPDVTAYLFDAYGRPEASGFFWSLVYWSLEGEPDRMDADLNGIPCETLYDAEVVSSVLAGGPTY